MSTESVFRKIICRTARALYECGLTRGSTGNLSVRLDDGWLMSPTCASLDELDAARLYLMLARRAAAPADSRTGGSIAPTLSFLRALPCMLLPSNSRSTGSILPPSCN
ncbi:MAG TPA: class II aldolase/adducin family protein [Burkholderiales bacterium]|nr:class II aldolase/adducin family protein [Burkholderiales bacterium]